MNLRAKIITGYLILVAVIGSMAAILIHERQRIRDIEVETFEIREIRQSINAIHHHITTLSISGENVIDWEEVDYRNYQIERLQTDSLLQAMKPYCINYVQPQQIDTLRILLAEKEAHLRHIMSVFERQEEADSLLVNHLPEVAKRATRVRTVQQKKKGIAGFFGGKKTVQVLPSAKEPHEFSDSLITLQRKQTAEMDAYTDSLRVCNRILNVQLDGLITELNGQAQKAFVQKERKIAEAQAVSVRLFTTTISTAIILLFLSYLTIHRELKRNVDEKKKREKLIGELQESNARNEELIRLRHNLIQNVSHELRTPLSLIINPLEEFFVDHPEYRKGILDMVKQNADYLLELINQLLDFRKLDAKAETLKCKHDNILIILSEIFHSFDPIAQKRNISYSFTSPQHSVFMDFDYDKIRKICTNILSNAFKFTPNKGSISLDIAIKGKNLELTFTDTGCGIEDESKEKIFQRFYQSGKNQSSNGGSGIGLHIVSEYVKMHQGTVCVKDNQPCGSVFLITLPLHQNSNETGSGELVEASETKEETHPFTILLVDDNYDFLKFLSESLARKYHVLKATNGKQALNVLEKEDIDLVVSDIMMPEMDGLELCSTIKNDIRYSHIPIILLTAKASEEHQLEGLNVGADDYITKPFNMEVLKLRINKIIEMNVKRQEMFNQDIKIEPSRITITPLDQQLVEKAIQIVEDNISETEFSVEELASSLNISRSYFYKKMIKITGKKPIEFIRTIRMKRAQQLLTESQMQVSEIAYTLGYNSPKVFSKHFKDEFNISPSEFIRQQAE